MLKPLRRTDALPIPFLGEPGHPAVSQSPATRRKSRNR
jgi:hypothetical protein